jgi:hypothetical protein
MKLSKTQEYLIIAGLLVLLFPFFALLFYVHPQGDDFFFAAKVNELGVLAFVKEMYLHWSGRYASMFIGAFDPVIYKSHTLLRLELGLLFLFNIFSVYLLFSSITKTPVSKRKLLLFTLAFYVVLLNAIPDIFEFMYWFPSVTAYQLGLSLLLIFVADIFFERKNRITKIQYLILNSIIAIIAVGLLELFVIPLALALVISAYFRYKNGDSIKADIIVLILLACSAIVLVAAPGNYERVVVENPTGVIVGFYLAAKSLIYLLGYLFQNPVFVLANILFLSFLSNWSEKIKLSFPPFKPVWIFLFTLSVSYLFFLPSTLALTSLPAGRIFDLAAFVFSLLWMFSLASFHNYYRDKYSFRLPVFYQKIIALLMLMFVFSGIYITNPYEFAQKKKGSVLIYGNILNAYHTLFFEAKAFDQDMIARYENFRAAEQNNQKTLVVKPLEHHPEMLIFVDITDIQSPGTWIFNWEARYYGMDSICIEKPDTIINEEIKQEIQENLFNEDSKKKNQ